MYQLKQYGRCITVVGKRQNQKPAAVANYNKKTDMEKSDQTLDYFSFQREKIKWWKFIFHHLDLAIVNGYILYIPKTMQKNPLQCFYKIVTKG